MSIEFGVIMEFLKIRLIDISNLSYQFQLTYHLQIII